jgi:hypothetical protein
MVKKNDSINIKKRMVPILMYECACGSKLKRGSTVRHTNSKKHQKYVVEQASASAVVCACGSKLKRGTTQRHLNSRKHVAYMQRMLDIEEEVKSVAVKSVAVKPSRRERSSCQICLDLKSRFVECRVCRNATCFTCWGQLVPANKCPFCRTIQ